MLSPRLSCVSGPSSETLALQLAHGALQHGGVQLEAYRFDVAALLAAQQIARAAQFQIERGNLEACAQIAELFQRGRAGGAPARVNSRSGGISRYAYARRLERPTRPRN